MRCLLYVLTLGLGGCSLQAKELVLPSCWDSKTLSLPASANVTAQHALVFYSPDGPLTLHPSGCDGAPFWLDVSDDLLRRMRRDESQRDWNGGKFFEAILRGKVVRSPDTPGRVIIRVEELGGLRRVQTPKRLLALDKGS